MKVVILCGGKGARAYPFTEFLPKPMFPIAGTPILVQVMKNYLHQGHREFVLAAGHRRAVIEDYFDGKNHDWSIEIVDTGEDTDTGGRIARCKDRVGETFFATYGDGLSDVALDDLLAFHRRHPGLATITSVPLVSQYGTLVVDGDGRVLEFKEKPVMREHWINAGFFVFDRAVFDHWEGENLERDVFPRLAQKGLVYTYHHRGFFKSLDSYKDQQEFEELVRQGRTPWLRQPPAGPR
jgi:glucose-1-phosphate cytidylyltransferase